MEVARTVIRLRATFCLSSEGAWFLSFLSRPNDHLRLYGMTEVDLSLWIVLAGLVVALGSLLTLLR